MKNKPILQTRTTEMVTIPRAEYEEYLELKKQNEWLLEQLRVIRNKWFGSSPEKASEEVYEQLSLLFDEAQKAMPKGKRSPTAQQGVAYCSQLFKLEEQFKDLTPEERIKRKRQIQVCLLWMREV